MVMDSRIKLIAVRIFLTIASALMVIALAAPANAQDAAPEAQQPPAATEEGKADAGDSEPSGGKTGIPLADAAQCLAKGEISLSCGANVVNSIVPGGAISAPVRDAVGDKVSEKASDLVEGQFGKIVASIGESALKMVQWMLGLFITTPSSMVLSLGDGTAGDKDQGLIGELNGYLGYLQLIVAVMSILAIAARFMMSKGREFSDHAEDAGMTLGRSLFAVTVWAALIIGVTRVIDGLSKWIFEETSKQASESVKGLLQDSFSDGWTMKEAFASAATLSSGGTMGIVLIFGILVIITSAIQMLLLFVRQGLLIFMTLFAPMVAAGGGLPMGKEMWEKLKSMTIALLLYKLVAAILYAIPFLAIKEIKEDDTLSVIVALLLFMLPVFAMPMLLSLLSPPGTGSLAGPSGMKIAGGAMGLAAGGAMMAASGGTSRALAGSQPAGPAGQSTGKGSPAVGGFGGSGGGGGGGGGAGFGGGGESGPSPKSGGGGTGSPESSPSAAVAGGAPSARSAEADSSAGVSVPGGSSGDSGGDPGGAIDAGSPPPPSGGGEIAGAAGGAAAGGAGSGGGSKSTESSKPVAAGSSSPRAAGGASSASTGGAHRRRTPASAVIGGGSAPILKLKAMTPQPPSGVLR
ncbi:hypothetical protein [Corynebacterium suicordis]|uniref:Type IV secretion system protein n=1 Tax=Corynebacterium suicordis DSM 45110 TaxID=1121369 RepID=A0ABR9ZLV8_9CORY|nr:hypothetical protein [Corynebacterium suicordis]MBF4554380.1 hypothetical protein [Corynebacterium suicordis DSM 45110]MDR6278596.1 hypothetical protein [Corynebacterium suicordis]